MAEKPMKPGTVAPASGQIGLFGPRGGQLPAERTIVSGDRVPPTIKPGQSWQYVDRTNNGAGRRK